MYHQFIRIGNLIEYDIHEIINNILLILSNIIFGNYFLNIFIVRITFELFYSFSKFYINSIYTKLYKPLTIYKILQTVYKNLWTHEPQLYTTLRSYIFASCTHLYLSLPYKIINVHDGARK